MSAWDAREPRTRGPISRLSIGFARTFRELKGEMPCRSPTIGGCTAVISCRQHAADRHGGAQQGAVLEVGKRIYFVERELLMPPLDDPTEEEQKD